MTVCRAVGGEHVLGQDSGRKKAERPENVSERCSLGARETMESATEVWFYRPKDLPNPYPSGSWDDIREFSYDSDLHLLRLSNGLPGIPRSAQYIVGEPYTVSFRLDTEEDRRSITVPKGMLTDLASVPRCFRWYAGRVGLILRPRLCTTFCTWRGKT